MAKEAVAQKSKTAHSLRSQNEKLQQENIRKCAIISVSYHTFVYRLMCYSFSTRAFATLTTSICHCSHICLFLSVGVECRPTCKYQKEQCDVISYCKLSTS